MKIMQRLGTVAKLVPVIFIGQTNAMGATVELVMQIMPVLVLVLVLKMLFSSFKEVGKD